MGEISNGAQCFRILFIISNIIFLIFGLAVLGIGIWLVIEGNNYGETLTGDGYVAGGALLIVCGIITLFVSIVGMVGACFLLRIVLLIYILFVILICILELTAGIFGFIYREEISDEIDERMKDAIADYRETDDPDYQEDVNDGVEFVQERFDCCGADNYTDWINLNLNFVCTRGGFPDCGCESGEDGCVDIALALFCNDPLVPNSTFPLTFNASVWDTGCVDEVRDALEEATYVLGGIGIAFGVFEVLTILVALGLCCCITMSKSQTVV